MPTALSQDQDVYASTTATVYNQIAEKYESMYGKIHERDLSVDWLLSRLKQGSRVLDIGCGTGRPAAERLAAAGHEVIGLDISPTMLELARRNVPSATFEQVDFRSYSPPLRSFDAVCSFFSLFHMSRAQQAEMVRKIYSWLKPGGLFTFMIVPGDWDDKECDFMGHKTMESRFPVAEWLDLFQQTGFRMRKSSVMFVESEGVHNFQEYDLTVWAEKEHVAQSDSSLHKCERDPAWKTMR